MSYAIGIDLDNTIIHYDTLIHELAVKEGIIDASSGNVRKSKKHVRDQIRRLDGGELKWRKLQALAYGKEIEKVKLSPEVEKFFKLCRKHRIKAYIISHKTEFPAYRMYNVNLRKAALKWMGKNKFFRKDGLGISRKNVYFEPTKSDKVKRIKELGCTHFIDDLEETFLDKDFPPHVHKILYSADVPGKLKNKVAHFRKWGDICRYLFYDEKFDIKKVASELLKEEISEVEKLGGGRNSQAYKIRAGNNKEYVIKFYFQISDSRNRLKTEYDSISFMWKNKIRNVPEPVIRDEKHGCAIYGYIKGKKIGQNGIKGKDISFSAGFLKKLKNLSLKKESGKLGNASEASFSPQMMVANIEERLARLQNALKSAKKGKDAYRFINGSYKPALRKIARLAKEHYKNKGLSFSKKLDKRHRTLSPSDFGFHNALRTANNKIFFIDFEYFGWDDPAKMICDFLIHPAMKLGDGKKRQFFREAMNVFREDKNLAKRIGAYYPLCHLKWCLILLNEFLYNQLLRRKLASNEKLRIREVQRQQLLKSRKLLEKINKECGNLPFTGGFKHDA